MKFLYRYYFTFFQLHRRDRISGLNRNVPWFSAFLQITLGNFCLGLGLYWWLAWLTDSSSRTGGMQKYHLFLLLAVFTWASHYLLFRHFGVDKQSGLTEQYTFTVTREIRRFFWLFWISSLVFPFLLGYLLHHRN